MITSRITGLWPKSERKVCEEFEAEYTNARDTAIDDVIAELWASTAPALPVPSLADVQTLGGIVEQQVAELAVIRLVPFVQDIFRDGMISRSINADDGGSASEALHDKVRELNDLRSRLEASTARRQSLVANVIDLQPVQNVVDVPGVCDVPGLDSARRWLG